MYVYPKILCEDLIPSVIVCERGWRELSKEFPLSKKLKPPHEGLATIIKERNTHQIPNLLELWSCGDSFWKCEAQFWFLYAIQFISHLLVCYK